MAYIKTLWKERQGTNLDKYTKSGETASTVRLANAPDSVTEPGTAFTTDRMNHIEQGIADAHDAVAAEAATLNAHKADGNAHADIRHLISQMELAPGAAGPEGLNIWTSATQFSGSGSTSGVAKVSVSGRTIKVGDLVISTHASSLGYLGRVTAVASQTSVTVTYVSNIRGAEGRPGADNSSVFFLNSDTIYTSQTSAGKFYIREQSGNFSSSFRYLTADGNGIMALCFTSGSSYPGTSNGATTTGSFIALWAVYGTITLPANTKAILVIGHIV